MSAVRLRPLADGIGAEVLGVDLARGVDDAEFAAIWQAFLDRQVILFRDQEVPPGRQVEFARRFGEVQVHVMNQYHASGHPEFYFLSNLGPDGRPSGRHPDRGTMAWHTDGSWRRRTGQATIMYAEQVPATGGETWFCDMYGALDAFPESRRQALAGMRAIHNLDFSRNRRHGEEPMTEAQKREVPPVDHPVVRTHPDTGRLALFLGDHAEHVAGLDYDAGRALIEELNAEAVAAGSLYEHHYRAGDLVVWDNRCLQHRATGYDAANDIRVMRRCTIIGEVPA